MSDAEATPLPPSSPRGRRDWLATAGRLAIASAVSPRLFVPDSLMSNGPSVAAAEPSWRDEFPIAKSLAYLNNAAIHPMSRGALRAVRDYLDGRTFGAGAAHSPDPPVPVRDVKAKFAALVNAKPTEISYVPSTMVGENLVVAGLGIAGGKGNVVTDALHFEASLYMYQSLQRDRGLDLRLVMPRDWRIDMRDLERVIDRDTKLVAISLVSFLNGFEHDLKAVCDLAHAHGAYVYADVIQAAGAIPIDVRASGVDFCACSSYKWLQGDLGIGFFYVREDLLDRVLPRTQYGHRQVTAFDYHFLPGDPPAPGGAPVTWERGTDAGAHFEVGTWSTSTIAALTHSLDFIQRTGVDRIQAHNLALARRVRAELPRLGYPSLTPPESRSSISAFALEGPAHRDAVARRLAKAKVDVGLEPDRMRVSPSLYNDDHDVDALLNALS